MRTIMRHSTHSLRVKTICLASAVAIALSGAVFAQGPRPSEKASVVRDKDGFTTAVAGKPGSGVTVRYRVEGTPTANAPITVSLQLAGVRAADAKVSVNASEGAVVDSTRAIALSPGATHNLQVRVTPSADGYYYLHVRTEQGGRSTVTSVPIQVGKTGPKLAKEGTLKTMPTGERVVSLPAAR